MVLGQLVQFGSPALECFVASLLHVRAPENTLQNSNVKSRPAGREGTWEHRRVEDTEPYPNSFSKPNHIHKACLFNTLSHIKSIQPVGPREKFNSLHFPETENGRGFDSRLNTRRCVLQLMSELTDIYSFDSVFLLKLTDPVVVTTRSINCADKLLDSHSPDSISIF